MLRISQIHNPARGEANPPFKQNAICDVELVVLNCNAALLGPCC